MRSGGYEAVENMYAMLKKNLDEDKTPREVVLQQLLDEYGVKLPKYLDNEKIP